MHAVGFDELHDLETSLLALAAVPLSCLSAEELGVHLVEVQRLRARMDALVCGITAAADAAGTHTLGPSRTIASWVGAETNADPGAVGRDRSLGIWLRAFPDFATAFRAGVLTRRHVEGLRGVDNQRTRARLVEAQGYLIEAARDCSWRDFKRALAYWLLAGDPDGEEPRQQLADRKLTLTDNPDGTLSGTFRLDPIAAAAVKTAVKHRAQRLWRDDQQLEPDQRRTRRQLYADAMTELIANGFRRQDGTTPRPLVHVVMSPDVADDMLRRLDAELDDRLDDLDEELPIDPADVDRRCELADGTPIHPLQGLAAITSGVLRRLVIGAEPEQLDLGTAVRDFPGQLRDALMAAHRSRCVTPGCDAPPEWLQIDHIIPWARGGPTALWNGQVMCDPDNKAKTDTVPP